MITSQQLVLASAVSQMAGVLSDDGQQVTLFSPPEFSGSKLNSGSFISRYSDSSVFAFQNEPDAIARLAESRDNALALDFWLLLLDADVKVGTKKSIAAELELMFERESCFWHVQNILSASPIPESADTQFITGAELGKRVRDFADMLIRCQGRIKSLQAAWIGMREDAMVKAVGHERLTGVLIRTSVFRRLVSEVTSQSDLEAIRGTILMDQTIRSYCDPRIISSLLADWKAKLPAGTAQAKTRFVQQPMKETIEEREAQSLSRPAVGNAENRRERAKTEVTNISKLFAEGKDLQARQYLDELIDRQTADPRDLSYAVMSLCNIANRCSTAGRRDVGFACLTRAVELPKGLDAILYLQIGNEFRSIREFDKAIDCYEKAKAIDDGSKAESIRDEIIRVSVAKGEYDRALEQYLTIEEFNFLPSTHTSLGTLYRKMGSLADARQCYWKVIKGHQDFNHVAKIGLAETAKQSGNLRQAFRLYNDVLRTENIAILDQGAHRVYEFGRCHLYRLTGQFEKADIAMNGLLSQFPLDHEIHFQLAKNYSLMGNDELANMHIKQAIAPDLSGIAAELYAIAMHRASICILPSVKDSSKIRIEDYMPEDRGLASCKLALASIVDSDFKSAVNILRNAHYVDKLHQDFGTVLNFHALKQLDSNFDYRRVRAIGRIAKRGYRPLRESVNAIAEGKYDVAIAKECRLCLLVA